MGSETRSARARASQTPDNPNSPEQQSSVLTPTLIQEQLNARCALERRRAQAEIAAVESKIARDQREADAQTGRENEEIRARIAATAAGPNTGAGHEDTVGPLSDGPPQEFLDSIPDLSYSAKMLLWYGLPLETRQGHASTISSYTLFCATRDVEAWPASELVLVEWISERVFSNDMAQQGRITADTIQGHLLALKSYHVDRNLPTEVFSTPLVHRILSGVTFLRPSHSNLN